jgi:hypothetical protein
MKEQKKPKDYKKPRIVYEKKIETLAAVCDTAWIGPSGTCCMGGGCTRRST